MAANDASHRLYVSFGSGDSAFATGYVGAVHEPTLLAVLPLAGLLIQRRRKA